MLARRLVLTTLGLQPFAISPGLARARLSWASGPAAGGPNPRTLTPKPSEMSTDTHAVLCPGGLGNIPIYAPEA